MVATYTDQFFVMDPGAPPAKGTALSVVKIDYIDQDNNGFISPAGNDSAGGLDITSVWVDDTITVVMNGVTQKITGVTFYRVGGPAIFTPTDGTVLTNAVFQSSTWVNTSTQIPVGSFGPACFAAGTLIETAQGARPIETLLPGDLIPTRDNGLQPVIWIGRQSVAGRGDLAPIRFAPGAMGNHRALRVSPQHRMLLVGWRAELYLGQDEVLVAAKHLVNADTIHRAPCDRVEYCHLLFARHEIILAEGVPSESFHPGDHILSRNSAMRTEILGLFPELANESGTAWPTARYIARAHEATIYRAAV
ncbi:MAG: Hint domain-containing protein [Paracoccaceae bacterium]|nr:Hint domain-containing protein [Paracoccaceae bacterium]